MKSVWKYTISKEYENQVVVILMPERAQLLSSENQRGETIIWALVDPSSPLEERRFFVATTGGNIPYDNLKFVGTVLHYTGIYVLHIFEIV